MKTEITDFIRLTNEGTRCVYLSDLAGFVRTCAYLDPAHLELKPYFRHRDVVLYYFHASPDYFDDAIRAILKTVSGSFATQYGEPLLTFADMAEYFQDLLRAYIAYTFKIKLFI